MPETPDVAAMSVRPSPATVFGPELVFSVLSDATRRSANLVNKHLMLMRDAGLVTAVESPVRGDRRRSLFCLVPALRPADPTLREPALGCCVLRLTKW